MNSQPSSKILDNIRQACGTCSLNSLCLPMGLSHEEMLTLDQLVKRQLIVNKGEYLFRMEHHFDYLYAIRAGSFKTFLVSEKGTDQITGFYLPGELLGFDGIEPGHHQVTAVALETSSVCQLKFDELLQIASKIQGLQRHLMAILSQRFNNQFTISVNHNAEQRIARFLLSLSERFKRRGYSADTFNLTMSRQEIGNYLGLANETVSRILAKFREQGILESHQREMHLLDLRALQMTACG